MNLDEKILKRRRTSYDEHHTSDTLPSNISNAANTSRQQQRLQPDQVAHGCRRGALPPAGDVFKAQDARTAASSQTARHAKQHAEPAAAQAAARTAVPPPVAAAAAVSAGLPSSAARAADTSGRHAGSSAPLSGTIIYLHGSIPLLQRRIKVVTKRLQELGAAVPATTITTGGSSSSTPSILASITHIVLHPSDADVASATAAAIGHGGSSSSSTGAAQNPASPASALHVLQLVHKLQQQQRQRQATIKLVSDAWLDAVLQAGRHVPEQQYSLQHLLPGQGFSSSETDSDGAVNNYMRVHEQHRPRDMPELDPSPGAPMGKFAMWLGRWEAAYNNITTQVELVLQGNYSRMASAARGQNEAVRGALKELEQYETAIAATSSRDIGGWGPGTIAHEALTYAHAAAVVRGCSFPLHPSLSPSRLQKLLPFVGAFTAKIIHQLIATGTCEQLEAFRQDLPVANSQGQIRPNTAGAATRALFVKLPGVGPTLADRWCSLGFRSFEALLQAASEVGLLNDDSTAAAVAATVQIAGGGGTSAAEAVEEGTSNLPVRRPSTQPAVSFPNTSASQGLVLPSRSSRSLNPSSLDAVPFSREALYSLQHSADLLEAVPPGELHEMQQEVLCALAAVTGTSEGWKMQVVGGGRRDSAVHDADYLITNDDGSLIEGLVDKVYRQLVAAGRLVPEEQGFCRVQRGRMPGYKSKARLDVLLGRFDHNHQMDHYDHIWGIYLTKAGKRRRIDLMFIPPALWTMAVIGWTGSKQYLRFMRHHAGNCGMNLNSHYLMRKVDLVPGAGSSNNSRSKLESANQPGKPSPAAAATPAESNVAATGIAEALSYVAAAAASGASRVVLSVPDEAPPADRLGQDWWPQGWTAAATTISTAAAGGGDGSDGDDVNATTAAAAAAAASGGDSGPAAAAAAATSPWAQLAALVAVGMGSGRSIRQERDLFDILGIRYLEPEQRNA